MDVSVQESRQGASHDTGLQGLALVLVPARGHFHIQSRQPKGPWQKTPQMTKWWATVFVPSHVSTTESFQLVINNKNNKEGGGDHKDEQKKKAFVQI